MVPTGEMKIVFIVNNGERLFDLLFIVDNFKSYKQKYILVNRLGS